MVRKLVLASVGALVLALAPAASAKGPISICGASGCSVMGQEGQQLPVRFFGLDPATPTVSAPAPAPYFKIGFGDAGTTSGSALGYWSPSAGVLRVQGQPWRWVATLPSEDTLLRELTAGLQPFSPPTRPSVYVDYDPVKRSDGYLRLLSMGTPVPASPYTGSWLEIWFMGKRYSPWTDGTTSLAISRKGSLLKRDGQVFRIPLSVAKRVRARLPLS